MIEIYGKTDIGNFRTINQDHISILRMSDDEVLAIVCDGMGGHKAGEIASQMACQYVLDHFQEHAPFESKEEIESWLYVMIENANIAIHEASTQNIDYEGMGTTVVLAYVNRETAYISHVGDSRAYLFDGELNQLTVDDTLANALVASGYLSQEAARYYPQKNILVQAVGVSSPLTVSFCDVSVQSATLLLCTDGLFNSLSDEKMKEIICTDATLEEKTDQLIELAKKEGGYDNIGLILIERKNAS